MTAVNKARTARRRFERRLERSGVQMRDANIGLDYAKEGSGIYPWGPIMRNRSNKKGGPGKRVGERGPSVTKSFSSNWSGWHAWALQMCRGLRLSRQV